MPELRWLRTRVVLMACLIGLPAACVRAESPPLSANQSAVLATHVRPGYPFRTISKWTVLQKSASPMPLKEGALDEAFRWRVNGEALQIGDYLDRQPITGLLVAKDGVILYEAYRYTGSRTSLFLSNSMAKSVLGLGYGFLQQDGLLESPKVSTETWLPEFRGSNLGAVTLRNHLRMASGLKYDETYTSGDDHDRFGKVVFKDGQLAALDTVKNNDRLAYQGNRYYYAGFSSATLGLVAERITGMSVAKYVERRLWKPLGTEEVAAWTEDVNGSTLAYCCLLARPRDWLRLGVVLANGGQRPDTGEQVIPRAFIDETIEARGLDAPFRPRANSWGYENQFWIGGRSTREFGLIGVRGQSIFISQTLNLVMVQFAVNESPKVNETTMAAERNALWRALVSHFDK